MTPSERSVEKEIENLLATDEATRADMAVALQKLKKEIAERERAEQERIRLTTAIEQTAEVVIITDLEGRIQYINPAFERTTGYSRLEAVGRSFDILESGAHDETFYRRM